MSDKTQTDKVDKLGKMIGDIKIAMMTTAEPGGAMRSRPMWTAGGKDEKFGGELWFFTYAKSGKVHEFETDRHVNLSYAEPSDQEYVSVSGKARLSRDGGKIDELWTDSMKAWFPDGKQTDGIALICVNVDHAEYWDAPNSTMVHLYGVAKAALTGESASGDMGENEKVSL